MQRDGGKLPRDPLVNQHVAVLRRVAFKCTHNSRSDASLLDQTDWMDAVVV